MIMGLIVWYWVQVTQALEVHPLVVSTGQALEFDCDLKESAWCVALCGNEDICQLAEPWARDAAGTRDLNFKRLQDSIGSTAVAGGEPVMMAEWIHFLRNSGWISYSARSIYNYSSPFDGAEIKAKMKQACAPVGGVRGIAIFNLESKTHQVLSLNGFFCTDSFGVLLGFYPAHTRQ